MRERRSTTHSIQKGNLNRHTNQAGHKKPSNTTSGDVLQVTCKLVCQLFEFMFNEQINDELSFMFFRQRIPKNLQV